MPTPASKMLLKLLTDGEMDGQTIYTRDLFFSRNTKINIYYILNRSQITTDREAKSNNSQFYPLAISNSPLESFIARNLPRTMVVYHSTCNFKTNIGDFFMFSQDPFIIHLYYQVMCCVGVAV